jgi:hypothetical protein
MPHFDFILSAEHETAWHRIARRRRKFDQCQDSISAWSRYQATAAKFCPACQIYGKQQVII